MEAKNYSIMHCKDGNLYINRSRWSEIRSEDSKRFSEEDLGEIKSWIKQNNEYIQVDAFIEKAENYLRNKCQRFILTEKDIEDFVNYIKEE